MKPLISHNRQLQIILADDVEAELAVFNHILEELSIPTQLTSVVDGEQLMKYLSKHSANLPDILFLDLNMPRKNGFECLIEIKHSKQLKQLPVVIYSTACHKGVTDELYKNGAHYYLRKTDLKELQFGISSILTMITENKFIKPERKRFILNFDGAEK
jgi:CheY-like chemotaxis protein